MGCSLGAFVITRLKYLIIDRHAERAPVGRGWLRLDWRRTFDRNTVNSGLYFSLPQYTLLPNPIGRYTTLQVFPVCAFLTQGGVHTTVDFDRRIYSGIYECEGVSPSRRYAGVTLQNARSYPMPRRRRRKPNRRYY